MNKLTKALLVAGSVAVLAACGSSNKTENGNKENAEDNKVNYDGF